MAYIDLTSLTATLLIITCISYLIAFFRHTSIRHIPGPRLASFSNLWLMYQCRRGRRYKAVDAAHEKYGTFVRIQPHHVSIADPDAIPIIYGHGNGFLKRFDLFPFLYPFLYPFLSICLFFIKFIICACVYIPFNHVLINDRSTQRILRRLCLDPTRSVQHKRSSRTYTQTKDDFSHV